MHGHAVPEASSELQAPSFLNRTGAMPSSIGTSCLTQLCANLARHILARFDIDVSGVLSGQMPAERTVAPLSSSLIPSSNPRAKS